MESYNIEILDPEARKRYMKKLEDIGMDCCPYLLPGDVWENDPTKWPPLEYPELYTYLIETPGVFTREAMKSRKSLEAHNQFISGWVRTILCYEIPSTKLKILKADVMPSQRLNDPPHTPWISLNCETASVINAHCTCMAGLGESCTHIGALLFKIEAAVRGGFTTKACTEEACKWNDDFKENILPQELCKIQLYNKSAVESFNSTTKKQTSFPAILPTNYEKTKLLEALSQQKNVKSVVLHCYSEYCDPFIPNYKPPDPAQMPPSLRDHFSEKYVGKNNDELLVISKKIIDKMEVSLATVEYVMNMTKKQNSSIAWHEVRTGRITASTAHDVLHTNFNYPAPSIIKAICKKSFIRNTNVPSLKWGIDHENDAIEDKTLQYTDEHPCFEIVSCGIRLSEKFPFLVASPDGIFSCSCHSIKRLLEVKCPFTKKDTRSIQEAASDKSFFIDSELQLKRTHKYFTQIQMQIYIFHLVECELIV